MPTSTSTIIGLIQKTCPLLGVQILENTNITNTLCNDSKLIFLEFKYECHYKYQHTLSD